MNPAFAKKSASSKQPAKRGLSEKGLRELVRRTYIVGDALRIAPEKMRLLMGCLMDCGIVVAPIHLVCHAPEWEARKPGKAKESIIRENVKERRKAHRASPMPEGWKGY